MSWNIKDKKEQLGGDNKTDSYWFMVKGWNVVRSFGFEERKDYVLWDL